MNKIPNPMRVSQFMLVLMITIPECCDGLANDSSSWHPIPHCPSRREVILSTSTAATVASSLVGKTNCADAVDTYLSASSINSHLAIPVWPSWGGGRVIPISLEQDEDPFLLLAHHKHWFDPKDPLREPFKLGGKALGLPYIDVEGFSMHPHRGLDILTYILDGSDGFCHRDTLSKETRTMYRGGCAQWMRTGSGVQHEEFWETRKDRRTNIELFQLWINLPSSQKFDLPAVKYIGSSTDNPWIEETLSNGVHTRDIGTTLTDSLQGSTTRSRPPVQIQHVKIPPQKTWEASILSPSHSTLMYVREGTATILGRSQQVVQALQSATMERGEGDKVLVKNNHPRKPVDFLLLSGQPLNEPVAIGGPIVMNTEQELYDAYRQLRDGTFLEREIALRQQMRHQS